MMVKIYKAKPLVTEHIPYLPPKTTGYTITPEAQVHLSQRPEQTYVPSGVMSQNRPQRGSYQTLAGSEHDLEIYVLDSASKRPLRSVLIKAGLLKGHTDRLGKLTLRLPTGFNSISLEGIGFVEKGNFTPEKVTFDPIGFEVDLDAPDTITVYTTGEIVQGERHNPNNPHPPSSQMSIPIFIQDNWQMLGLIGASGIVAYYLGTRSKDS